MKILAIDIGEANIKFIELEVTFGRTELIDYVIEKVDTTLPTTSSESIKPETTSDTGETKQPNATTDVPKREVLSPQQLSALKKVITSRPTKYDKLVIQFPKSFVSTRLFDFPTKDRKTIQSSLDFELDDEIPFPVEDITTDFAIVNSEGPQSTIYAAIALKSDLQQVISELQLIGIDPDIITIDSWAYSQLLKRVILPEYSERPVCILNIGATRTGISFFANNSPLVSHFSNCAGLDITKAIAQEYSLNEEEAEKAKIEGAFLLTQTHIQGGSEFTQEQIRFSSTIERAITPLLREVKQTLMAIKSQYKLSPRAIFLTGGTSLIPNLPLFLEEQFGIAVYQLRYMTPLIGESLKISEQNESLLSLATSLAVTAIKPDRNNTINYRKDSYAKKGGPGTFNLTDFKKPILYISACLVFVYINLIFQWFILSSRINSQNAHVERAIKSVFGPINASLIRTYVSSPSSLRTAVQKEITKNKVMPTAPKRSDISAFDVLNKISSAMPRDMTLDVTQFEIREQKLRLTGIVDKMQGIDKIAKALQESNLLSDISKNRAEEDPKLKKVKFEFTAKVGTNVKTR